MSSLLFDRFRLKLLLLAVFGLALPLVSSADTLSNEKYVASLYQKVFNRQPTSLDLSFWTTALDNNTDTRYDVAFALLSKDEYLAILTNRYYSNLLGRSPSSGELAFAVSALGSLGPETVIADDFLGTNEYFQNRAGSSNPMLIDDFFGDLLGRSPTPGEASFFLTQLAGSFTATDVALEILNSDEYRGDLTGGWYQAYLNRTATSTETNFILQEFSSGDTDSEIVAQILSLDEFYQDAQSGPAPGVPEPASATLLASGLVAIIVRRFQARV